MKAAIIVMTILGCDDTASQCHYISTVDRSWESVATCDAESEKQLSTFTKSNYPVVVAVCETSGSNMTVAEIESPPPNSGLPITPETTAAPEEHRSMPRRAMAILTESLPSSSQLRELVSTPVHYIEGSYSWVARKFEK